jgi:hypothetical protein
MIVEITGYDRPHLLSSVTHSSALDISSTLDFEPWTDRPGCAGRRNCDLAAQCAC